MGFLYCKLWYNYFVVDSVHFFESSFVLLTKISFPEAMAQRAIRQPRHGQTTKAVRVYLQLVELQEEKARRKILYQQPVCRDAPRQDLDVVRQRLEDSFTSKKKETLEPSRVNKSMFCSGGLVCS